MTSELPPQEEEPQRPPPSAAATPARSRGTWLQRHSRALSLTLLVLGAVLVVPASLFLWANTTMFNSEGFADASGESLDDEAVQDRLSTKLSERIVARDGRLLRAEPLIKGASIAVIASQEFNQIFREAVDRLHTAFFREGRRDIVLDLTAALARIQEVLRVAAPELAAQIPAGVGDGTIALSQNDTRVRIIELGHTVDFLAFVLPIASVVALGASVAVARPRTAAVYRLGLALAIVAAVVLLALFLAATFVSDAVRNSANRDAVDGIFWAFADSLRVWMRVVGVAGLVLAAGAWWVGNKGWPGTPAAGRDPGNAVAPATPADHQGGNEKGRVP